MTQIYQLLIYDSEYFLIDPNRKKNLLNLLQRVVQTTNGRQCKKNRRVSLSYWVPVDTSEIFLRPIRTFLVGHCLGLLFESKCEFHDLSAKKPHI